MPETPAQRKQLTATTQLAITRHQTQASAPTVASQANQTAQQDTITPKSAHTHNRNQAAATSLVQPSQAANIRVPCP